MSMDALVQEVLGQVRGIARDVLRREGTTLRTATVESVSPLRIRYDGETEASIVPPRRVARVGVGDRVVVAKARGQATVLGALGGPITPWQSITPASPWTPYVGGGSYAGGIRARRTPLGVQTDAMIVGGAVTSTICYLPENLQTGQAHHFNATVNAKEQAIVYYHADGRVQLMAAGASVNYLIFSHLLPD